ncbi:unnamed protein product, partial [Bubo scandiacus]
MPQHRRSVLQTPSRRGARRRRQRGMPTGGGRAVQPREVGHGLGGSRPGPTRCHGRRGPQLGRRRVPVPLPVPARPRPPPPVPLGLPAGNAPRRRAPVRGGEPAGRRLRQRAAAAQRHPAADRGAGAARHPALRHQPPAPRLPRLRQQDPGPLQRDRLHPARGHRRQQAAGHHPQRGQAHPRLQAGRPGHLRLGDPRPAAGRRRLRQVQRPLGQLHQQDPAEQNREPLPARALRRQQAAAPPARPALQPHLPVPLPRPRGLAGRQNGGTPRGARDGGPRQPAPLLALGALRHQHPRHPHLRGADGGSGWHRGVCLPPQNGRLAQREQDGLPPVPGGQRHRQSCHGRRYQIPAARPGALVGGRLPPGLRLPSLQPAQRLRRGGRRLHPPGPPLAAAGQPLGPPRAQRGGARRRPGHGDGVQAAREGSRGQKTWQPCGEVSRPSKYHPRTLYPSILFL